MKKVMILVCVLSIFLCVNLYAAEDVRLVTDRSLELTGFQDPRAYTPEYDLRNDFVMVYGVNDKLPGIIQTWVDKGYVPHLMTGMAWGEYQDFEDVNGNDIMSISQVEANGNEKGHGYRVPYVVPSVDFSDYIFEKLKPMIDAGVLAIHLEEPEFWSYTGFSKAFQREWELYYDEPFVRPDTSADAQYKASRLKYYLYSRALRRVSESCKEYAWQKYKRKLRMYVPTHSLINYTHWGIVSPQSSLIDSDVIDGCIAQIWTGTSRTENIYNGVDKERTFETAFLEYGVMQELVRNTNRDMWFLHDPIEDNSRYDWDDYSYNYKATLIASLLHPHVWNYEICPWPSRVFMKKYPSNSPNARYIPEGYFATLCIVFNQMRDMNQPESEWVNPTHGIGAFLADSGMFQRAEPAYKLAAKNGDDPKYAEHRDIERFSGFYGLTLPLLKNGIPVQPVQLDNVSRFANYISDYKVLVLSYEFFKPETPAMNLSLAEWVAKGGSLVYVGADTDPFNKVGSWWNTGENNYDAPSEHLFDILGLGRKCKEGEYSYGKGNVFVARKHPAYYTRSEKAADEYRGVIEKASKAVGLKYEESNSLELKRGPYVIAACLEESVSDKPLVLEGLFVDIYNAKLEVVEKVVLKPGQRAWLMDMDKLEKGKNEPVASSARFESWSENVDGVKFELKSPKNVKVVGRVRLSSKPGRMVVDGKAFDGFSWDDKSSTLFFDLGKDSMKHNVELLW